MPAGNTTVQLLAPYIDHDSHSAQRYRQTDGQTDVTLMPIADHTVQQYDWLKISIRFTQRDTTTHLHLQPMLLMSYSSFDGHNRD